MLELFNTSLRAHVEYAITNTLDTRERLMLRKSLSLVLLKTRQAQNFEDLREKLTIANKQAEINSKYLKRSLFLDPSKAYLTPFKLAGMVYRGLEKKYG